jgi:NSS family neurotransmitter:Na+ symporter
MIAYGSFQARKPEITNNAFITALANCGTSFFAGFAVFSTLGYLAFVSGVPVAEVSTDGTGLAFMVYPTAISKLPALNSLFAVIFFAMLLTLGIDSAFALQEAFTTGICDKWKLSKDKVNLIFCVFACLISLIYATYGGYYWFDITDAWIGAFGLVVAGLMHCVLVGYFLDMKKFREHINAISELKVGSLWIFMVRYLTPVVLTVILIINIRNEIREPYGGYPAWATVLGGWLVLVAFAVLGWYFYKKKAPSDGGES